MRARTAGALGLALLLAGCGTSTAGTGGTAGTGDAGSGAPETVDCGKVSLGQGETAIPSDKLTCLGDAAAAGTPATLAVLALTTEGDVITTTYTVVDTGTVRVLVDNTQDAFAGDAKGITQQTCDLDTSGGQIATSGCTSPEPF